jgi:hypothetical protein
VFIKKPVGRKAAIALEKKAADKKPRKKSRGNKILGKKASENKS